MKVKEAREKRIKERGIGNYSVYRHTSPSGKVYIGITSLKPRVRWGYKGEKYIKNNRFYSAICKYGWDNFTHEVLFENLDYYKSSELEKNLIRHYKNLGISYNISDGNDYISYKNYTISYYGSIYQVDPINVSIVKIWNNIFEIEDILGYPSKVIEDSTGILDNKLKLYKGYFWILSKEINFIEREDILKELISYLLGFTLDNSIINSNYSSNMILIPSNLYLECIINYPDPVSYNNLEWMFKDEINIDKGVIHQLDKRTNCEIVQINRFSGEVVKQWKNLSEIKNADSDHISTIYGCLNNAIKHYKDCIWLFKEEYSKLSNSSDNKIITPILSKTRKRSILQLDPVTLEVVKDWGWSRLSDIVESFGNGIRDSDIVTCCGYPKNGKLQKSAKGYVWQYKDVFENLTENEKDLLRTNKKGRVLQLDKTSLELIKVWDSSEKAAKTLGINHAGVLNNLNKRTRSSAGYVWRYETVTSMLDTKDNKNKKISKYSIIDFKLIKSYNSISEATIDDSNKLSFSMISDNINGYVPVTKDFCVFIEDCSNLSDQEIQNLLQKRKSQFIEANNIKIIIRVSKNLEIDEYFYLNQASSDSGISIYNIKKCCNNKNGYGIYNNFIWMYKDYYDKLDKNELNEIIKTKLI